MKRIAILGSTGSIGTQTLDVISQHPDELRAVALAANRNGELLLEQASLHGIKKLALYEGDPQGPIPTGMDSLVALATDDDVDLVVVSVSGMIGLVPTLAAIRHGKQVALASKEVLVAAGALVMDEVKRAGVVLTPIDSEHSAIFQCLQGYSTDQLARIFLTASGGPFRGKSSQFLDHVTVEDALNHPTWRMGGKITIDSASLMNKALELIEAHWLFNLEGERIEVVVHPQSIVHSMVQFRDGSVLGQMGYPDMRLPISYALLYPKRIESELESWSPIDSPHLTFEELDDSTFPSIDMAREVLNLGGTASAAFNAANEEAANAFLRGEIKFKDIYRIVGDVSSRSWTNDLNFESLIEVDAHARQISRKLMESLFA